MKKNLILKARSIHTKLFWVGLLAMLVFVISALSHPLMVWTGPQAQTFRPPTLKINDNDPARIGKLISDYLIDGGSDSGFLSDVKVAKLITTQHGSMFQITYDLTRPRIYLPLAVDHGLSTTMLKNYDQIHAKWLAEYYSGASDDIDSVEFISAFSDEYPWVNRLLPVYKVSYADDMNTAAYVFTETNALGSINNQWKVALQKAFRWFHTFSWLNDYPVLRLMLLGVMLCCLLLMTFTGVVFLWMIRRGTKTAKSRLVHRKIAWVLVLPIIGLVGSALYHLVQYEFGDNYRGMRLAQSMNLSGQTISIPDVLVGKDLNEFSIMSYNHRLVGRVSFSASTDKPGANRNKRFDGMPSEMGSQYFELSTGESISLSDQELARSLAAAYLGKAEEAVTAVEQVIRFGPEYDFRNKRLPVYKVLFDTPMNDRIFIDPKTGVMVDRLVDAQRYEGYSFSFLHKWNFLVPVLGREGRDIVVVSVLLLLLVLAAMGTNMRKNARKRVNG